jgi:hypothetical protein
MAEVQTQTDAGEMTQIFVEFVMMQAQNAALFLGQIPNPRGGQPEINLPLAKMFIDQLAVIRAKTHGNLNPDEQRVIDSAVGQLEAAFEETIHAGAHGLSGAVPGPASAFPAPKPETEAAPASATPPPDSAPKEPPAEDGRKRFTKSYGA